MKFEFFESCILNYKTQKNITYTNELYNFLIQIVKDLINDNL